MTTSGEQYCNNPDCEFGSEIDTLRAENVKLHTALGNLHREAQRLWTAESNDSLHEQAVDVWSDLIDAIEAAKDLVQ